MPATDMHTNVERQRWALCYILLLGAAQLVGPVLAQGRLNVWWLDVRALPHPGAVVAYVQLGDLGSTSKLRLCLLPLSPADHYYPVFCRRVKNSPQSTTLVSLDDGASHGPAVSAGQQLDYSGLKLRDANGTYWGVVYGEDGQLWRYPAADLAYCATTGQMV